MTTDPNQNARPRTPLHYVDRLRVLLVCLVVAQHAGQAYGPIGGDWPVFDLERSFLLGPFFTVNAAFFMGLFFCISGFFLPASLARKGLGRFLVDRLIHLGIPLVVIGFGLFALIGYSENTENVSFWSYYIGTYIRQWQVDYGPLWFVFHLLIYSAVYAGLAQVFPVLLKSDDRPAPRHCAIAGLVLIIAICTGLAHVFYSPNVWLELFGVVPFEAVHLPQYIILFTVGTIVGRHGWLKNTPTETGILWLKIGTACVAVWYAVSIAAEYSAFDFHQSEWFWTLYPVWEALTCVGLSVGLVIFARENWNTTSAWWQRLSETAYGVYLVHVFIIVGLNMALLGVPLPPFLKFLIVFVAALIVSFIDAWILKKLPFVSRVV